MIVVGIDPSISGTAVCSGRHDSKKYRCERYHGGSLRDDSVTERIRRYDSIVGRVMDHIEPLKPSVILIENYAFGKAKGKKGGNGGSRNIVQLAELGGILLFNLTDLTPHVFAVSQSTRLKFITGKGIAPVGEAKTVIQSAIYRDFRVSFDNDDMADAFAYWQIAKAAAAEPNTLKPHQLEALDTVFGARLKTVRALAQGVDCDDSDRDEAEASRTAAL